MALLLASLYPNCDYYGSVQLAPLPSSASLSPAGCHYYTKLRMFRGAIITSIRVEVSVGFRFWCKRTDGEGKTSALLWRIHAHKVL